MHDMEKAIANLCDDNTVPGTWCQIKKTSCFYSWIELVKVCGAGVNPVINW